jgi:hypothetical protein
MVNWPIIWIVHSIHTLGWYSRLTVWEILEKDTERKVLLPFSMYMHRTDITSSTAALFNHRCFKQAMLTLLTCVFVKKVENPRMFFFFQPIVSNIVPALIMSQKASSKRFRHLERVWQYSCGCFSNNFSC